MKRIILHIGTAKTGTTSLQHTLASLSHEMSKQGILYPVQGRPEAGPTTGHHLLPMSLKKAWGIRDERCWSQLIHEIDNSSCATVILSSEEFYNLKKGDLERLRTYLKAYSVTVVIYIRNHLDFMVSFYKQVVKIGKYRQAFGQFVDERLSACLYAKILDRWMAYAQPERLSVRCYDKYKPLSGGTVADFLQYVDFKGNGSLGEREHIRTYISPSNEAITLIRTANNLQNKLKSTPEMDTLFANVRNDLLHDQLSDRIVKALEPFNTDRQIYDDADLRKLRNLTKADKQELLETWIPESCGHFFEF